MRDKGPGHSGQAHEVHTDAARELQCGSAQKARTGMHDGDAYFAVTTMAWRATSIPLLSARNSIV